MNVDFLKAFATPSWAAWSSPDVRVALLRGAGKNFCAGGDVHTFASKGEGMPDYLRVATAWLQNAVTGLMRLEAPVIAAVHGFAAGGGGFGLVCASDLVIAADTAKFLAARASAWRRTLAFCHSAAHRRPQARSRNRSYQSDPHCTAGARTRHRQPRGP